jgi:hypothetical protein
MAPIINATTNMITQLTVDIVTATTSSPNKPELSECYLEQKELQKFAMSIKPYLYPASIEFSVICATVFAIMWTRIGSSEGKHRKLLTTTNFEDDKPYTPNPGMMIMLDCTKTSRGLFFGLLIFVSTILSTIVFYVYSREESTKTIATILSQSTEAVLLFIALIITVIAYFKVTKYYTKVIPQVNMFDVVLEVLSMFGIYAFSINSLVAIFNASHDRESLDNYSHGKSEVNSMSASTEDQTIRYVNVLSAVLSIIQGTIQTFFILECLRRYAHNKRELVNKPARELITALLLTNISLWFYDTLSGKRFDTNALNVEHFGILKWSIINAFSSPIAIFYRFHSSVCLSDIWYGLYYGENELPEGESEDGSSSSVVV